jgi:hypothetical protein
MRTVNRARAAQLAAIPYATLERGRYHGQRQPAAPHQRGKRGAEQWSMCNVLAVRVAKIIEHKFGTPADALVDLVNMLWNSDEDDLRAKFAAGRKFVMIVGRVPCGHALFTEEEIARNELLDYEAIAAAGFPMPVGLDISREWDKIAAALLLMDLNEEEPAKNSEPAN